ncbi:MAG: RNA 2',3'-cyclic phosphodiesterase [Candidatus Nanohaloarchaea archaeon]
MARVFSAIDIEDEEVLDELEHVRDRFDLGFNPVPREQIHVTLQFFQDIDGEDLEQVKQAMKDVDTESFEAGARGVGAFPSSDYIRVIWAGIDSPEVFDLYREVSQHEVREDSDHEFKPHATLVRVKNLSSGKKRKLQKQFQEFEDHYFGDFTVDSVKLYESEMTDRGPEYRLIHRREL